MPLLPKDFLRKFLKILDFLIKSKSCVCGDLVKEIGLAQPTISQHLKELKNCKIYNLDANDFNDYENIDFVYMYNPFGNKTMKSVLDNINKSRINKPRDILILYKNPIENDLLLENGFVCISTHNDHTREDNMVSKLYKKDYGNVS